MFKCTNDNGVKQIDPKTKGTKVLKTVRTQETVIENPSLNIIALKKNKNPNGCEHTKRRGIG